MNGGSETNRFTRIKASWCSGRGRRKGILEGKGAAGAWAGRLGRRSSNFTARGKRGLDTGGLLIWTTEESSSCCTSWVPGPLRRPQDGEGSWTRLIRIWNRYMQDLESRIRKWVSCAWGQNRKERRWRTVITGGKKPWEVSFWGVDRPCLARLSIPSTWNRAQCTLSLHRHTLAQHACGPLQEQALGREGRGPVLVLSGYYNGMQ